MTTVGFADNSDVTREALIPWIPLKAGQLVFMWYGVCSLEYGTCQLVCRCILDYTMGDSRPDSGPHYQ